VNISIEELQDFGWVIAGFASFHGSAPSVEIDSA